MNIDATEDALDLLLIYNICNCLLHHNYHAAVFVKTKSKISFVKDRINVITYQDYLSAFIEKIYVSTSGYKIKFKNKSCFEVVCLSDSVIGSRIHTAIVDDGIDQVVLNNIIQPMIISYRKSQEENIFDCGVIPVHMEA